MSDHQIDAQDVRIFSGQSHPAFAQGIADYLGVPLENSYFRRFSNDCTEVQLGASVRSRNVFIVQSLIKPVSERLLELFIMLDIAQSAGARNVHAIIPYYSYARSDKKDAPRISIIARLVANLLATAGSSHVMTMTLHSPQVHGFFSIPADPLTSRPVFNRYFEGRDLSSTVVVAPDMGHAKSAARFAKGLGMPVAAGDKERISDTEVQISGLVGRPIQGHRRAIIYDDEIATGGSIVGISQVLIEQGVQEIWVACTHGVFVHGGLERLVAIPQITEIVTTDTVYIPPEKRHPKLTVLSVAAVFGDAISRNYKRQSISDLFVYGEEG